MRALDWLSLLANAAEDVHVERRRRPTEVPAARLAPAARGDVRPHRALGVPDERLIEVIADSRSAP